MKPIRERLEAALYAIGRGNLEETREHVQAALGMLGPVQATAGDQPPPEIPPSSDQ